MRNFTRILLVFCLLPLSGCGNIEFSEFTSKEGGFSILMPGNPKKKSQSLQGTTLTMHIAEVRNGAFMVGYADIPRGRGFSLEDAVQGAARPYDGKILVNRDYTFEGVKGKEFEAKISNPDGYLAGRLIVINNRMYEIFAIGTFTRLDNADVQKFLNSFKLIK